MRGHAQRPLKQLHGSRPFVYFNDLLYLAARGIAPVPEGAISRTPTGDGAGEWVEIDKIQDALQTLVGTGRCPSHQGVSWGRPGGSAAPADLPRQREVVGRIRKPGG